MQRQTHYLLLWILSAVILVPRLQAQIFNPCVTLNTYYTKIFNYATVRAGEFNFKDYDYNLGLEITNKFSLSGNYLIKTGFRYNYYQTQLTGLNQASILLNKPDPFQWKKGYFVAGLPIYFGKNFTIKKDNQFEYFLGITPGILVGDYSYAAWWKAYERDTNVYGNFNFSITSENPLPPIFISTFDFGFNYQPLKKLRGLYIGILCSYTINRINTGNYSATETYINKNENYYYDVSLSQRYLNIGFSLNYYLRHNKTITAERDRTVPIPRGIFRDKSKLSLGIKAGPSISYLLTDNKFLQNDLLTDFRGHSGLEVNYYINHNMSIQSGLFYEKKGAKTKELLLLKDTTSQVLGLVNSYIYLDYLTLPLLLQYNIGRKIKYVFGVGAYSGVLLRSRYILKGDNTNDIVTNDKIIYQKPFDFGLAANAGVIIPVNNKFEFTLGTLFSRGFYNIQKNLVKVYNINGNVQLGLNYRLFTNKKYALNDY